MAKKQVVDVKGEEEKKPDNRIELIPGNISALQVKMLSGIAFQLTRIADALEKQIDE